MSNYSGYFLSSGKGASAEFFSTSCSAHPEHGISTEQLQGTNILLAGGFPANSPDSPFPLSVSLQLNGDLTDLGNSSMKLLAEAELCRYNSQSFRSYTMEADRRITVLGSSPESLRGFLNTYDALLQIFPLLTDSYAPDLTTAMALHVEESPEGYRLNFNVRRPIDANRCCYCGACGAACPENCISKLLFIDFTRCSSCNECLASCSQDAIDLHAVEKRELTTPALLFLDREEDLPQHAGNMYTEASLSSFFKTIYAAEVEEVIEWSASVCQYSPRLQSGCTACVDVCRHDAITRSRNGIEINHRLCVECGACLSSCPTGSLQYKRFDDTRFLEYFRSFPLPSGGTVIIGDEQSLHTLWWHSPRKKLPDTFFLEYPQPAALHAMHLLLICAMGAGQVVVLGKKDTDLSKQIRFSNELLQAIRGEQPLHMLPLEEIRSFLATEHKSSAAAVPYHDFSYSNRRTKLLDIILFLLQNNESRAHPDPINCTEDFGEILCDQKRCTQCLACVTECRMEALTADSSSYSLNHTPALCVQCGTCITVCPEQALSTRPGLFPDITFFEQKIISRAEPATCKGCGKVFGTRKSLEKVMAILSAKNLWDPDDDLLSYCDSCRVQTLYESHKK